MKEIHLTVTNDTGLHSRPADLFVRTAKLHSARIDLFKGDTSVDAKNVIKVILLNVSQGDQIRIVADGDDEETALQLLEELVISDFESVDERVTI